MRIKVIVHLLIIFAAYFTCPAFSDEPSHFSDDELLRLGLKYAEAGKVTEALEILNEAVGETPTAKRFMALGILYLQKGEYDNAYNNLSEALSRDPNLPPARFFMALLYEKKGMPRDALNEWKSFIAICRKKHFRAIADRHIKQLEKQLETAPR